MKLNRSQKILLKKKLGHQKNWFLLSKTYPEKIRESYILLYKSIQEHQDKVKNKWQSLIRIIGGKEG